MAFFKFRKGGGETVASPSPSESVEAMRRRARQRLIGAAVLVLLGVIGFPLVFDTQPRPVAIDIPIEVPDRAKAKPLAVPPPVAVSVGSEGPAVEPAPAAAAASAPPPAAVVPSPPLPALAALPAAPAAAVAKAEPRPEAGPEAKSEARAEPRPEPKAEAKPAKPEAKPAAAQAADGDRARALLEGKPVSAASAAAEGRFVVQVGAFADASKASAARSKLEKAGLKTYTHVAETKEGKRVRVRVGPFASRAEADKAAGKVKGLDLPAAVLTL